MERPMSDTFPRKQSKSPPDKSGGICQINPRLPHRQIPRIRKWLSGPDCVGFELSNPNGWSVRMVAMTTQADVQGLSERQQVKQRFLLHSVDALLGRRLPDRKELLMGMPFFKGALEEDVLRFCSKTLKRISDQVKPDSEIVGLLTRITYLNIPKTLDALDYCLERFEYEEIAGVDEIQNRIKYYLFAYGDERSQRFVMTELSGWFSKDMILLASFAELLVGTMQLMYEHDEIENYKLADSEFIEPLRMDNAYRLAEKANDVLGAIFILQDEVVARTQSTKCNP